MKTQKSRKIFTVCLVLVGLSTVVQAQKLNNIQEKSVWSPANIKIDGKLNEWDDTFQAYNKTTDIYYTISNDDKNLYFAIKSTVPMVNNKIMAGGINFAINTADKKKDKDKDVYTVVFPLIDMSAMRNQMGAARRVTVVGGGGGGGMGGAMIAFGGPAGPPMTTAQMDSASLVMRRKALQTVKEIKVLGFAETDIPDSVISIYNEYGVKAAVDYDAKGNLTCEMAISLKYLHLSADNPKEFSYNIKLNGLNLASMMPPGVTMSMAVPDGGGGGGGVVVTRVGGGGGGFGGGGGGDMVMGAPPRGMPSMGDMQNMISPTDFWGKYTLAKKQ